MNAFINYQRLFSIGAVLLFYLFLQLVFSYYYPPAWDASVYILMGKYLFSSGEAGLIEPFRPILWPGMLGLLWKSGLDPIIIGKFLSLVFALGNIFLVYKIGKIIFDKKVGLLAAFLLSLSPMFFYWGQSIYTDIPSSFLGLLTLYLYLKESYVWSGISGALAVQTKFIQVLTVFIISLASFLQTVFLKRPQSWLRILAGFILCSIPFFIFNKIQYGDCFYPFLQAQMTYTQIQFSWCENIYEVIKKLIMTEGIFLAFIPLSFIYCREKSRPFHYWLIVVLALGLLVWIGKLPTNLLRFPLGALPYLYLLAALGMKNVYEYLNRKQKNLGRLFVFLMIGLMIYQIGRVVTVRLPQSRLTVFQKYVAENQNMLQGKNIWISNPKTLVFSNLKASMMMYAVPMAELFNITEADYIFFDSKDVPCGSRYDIDCEKDREKLIEILKNDFKRDFYYESEDPAMVVGIFHK